jgi:hypothetical protein
MVILESVFFVAGGDVSLLDLSETGFVRLGTVQVFNFSAKENLFLIKNESGFVIEKWC